MVAIKGSFPTTLRQDYADTFGEAQAAAIEAAALSHGNGINDRNKGDDHFRHAVLIAIGYGCVERFPDEHGITVSWVDFLAWCRKHKDYFATHDADMDYLAAVCGVYDKVFGYSGGGR